jgi:transposase
MATTSPRTTRRPRRPSSVAKPSGVLHPRVLKAGPEHFGIVAVDCAKARSKWMLADFYGRILVPPTTVEHSRLGFENAIAQLRQAIATHDLHDVIIAIEQTGVYHRPVKRAFTAAGFETRIVHPLTSKQFRLPADPQNKTDDTDLNAIHRAAVNGFGLIEQKIDPIHEHLKLLARHRRDLVRKNATLRNQIHVELDALLPGLSAAVGNLFDHEPARVIARRVSSAQEIRDLGEEGLAAILEAESVRYQRRSLVRILAWADQAPEGTELSDVHKTIFANLDDERLARLRSIRSLECKLAAHLVQTPYVLLMSIPGINVVSAADFAGEMGPIANYPSDRAITGRAGLFPARYQSDTVDRGDGPLVHRANHALRFAILQIADNLLQCNACFRGLYERWNQAGVNRRLMCVRAAKRFCRIAYRMVAGRQVFRHPSCRERHYIIEKLSMFHVEHETSMEQVLRDLGAAAGWIPPAERGAEAVPLKAAMAPVPSRRRSGPCRLGAILPDVLLRLGVAMVESEPKGEADLT